MEADFSGYATKAGLKCSDGRTITPDAFKHQDKVRVPLVWQHGHSDPTNVLGHAILEHREDGVYAYGFFNTTKQGQDAKILVEHKDITALSIFANGLVERAKTVLHGAIREVSLVLSGANPGALIDNIAVAHGDDVDIIADEAIIHTGLPLEFDEPMDDESDDGSDDDLEHADAADETIADIYETLSQKQKDVVDYMIGVAIDGAASDVTHANLSSDPTVSEVYEAMTDVQKEVVKLMIGAALDDGTAVHSDQTEDALAHQEGNIVTNVFEQDADGGASFDRPTLSHDQMQEVLIDAGRMGSLKESLLAHAGDYGIDDIEFLFPDARTITNSPDFLSRRMEWVANVLGNTKHSPFSRIKSVQADITADEARAKGYVKGNLKKDEIIKLLKRVTTPKTVYKKQKLDRDDIVDITDLDVVAWLKAEMRIMLDEEIAAAILIGDGREPDDEDKIDEDHIRPIAFDVDMYNHVVTLDTTPTPSEQIEGILRARKYYKGTGTPTFYTTDDVVTNMLLDKDTLGRRFYATETELAAALRVKEIVVVEAMERAPEIVGILVNLTDYTVGADQGGAIAMFDDFDIDYNQQKYLIETRISGALTKPKSAITIKQNPGTVVVPTAPTFVSGTGVVTIPTVTGVVYKNGATTLTAGAQAAIAAGSSVEIDAVPASSAYSFAHGTDADWVFTRP